MDAFMVEAFTLLSIGIAVIFLRTFTRIRQVGFRDLEADDYLMLLAVIPYTTETVLAHSVGAFYHGLTNSGMTDAERAALSPDNEEYGWRVNGSKIQVAGWCMYVTVLWVIKAALCAFYLRLTAGLAGFLIRIRVGFGLIGTTYIALICSFLFSCHPINHFWQISPNPGNLCQPALSKVYIFLTLALNIVTDVYLIFIPVPMLWRAQLPTVKKLGLIVLFSGAIFVMVAGILRCILILDNPITGPKRGSEWAVRESFVAVTTSSLPMIWGWLRQKLKPIFGSLLSSGRRGGGPDRSSIMLADHDDSTWRSRQAASAKRTTTTSRSAPKNFIHGDDASSEEILPAARGSGGITKQVEVSVSTSQPTEPQPLNYAHGFESRQ